MSLEVMSEFLVASVVVASGFGLALSWDPPTKFRRC